MINKVYFIHISIRPRHSTLGLMSRYSPCPDLLLYPVSSGKYFNLSGIQPEIFQYILHPTGNISIYPAPNRKYFNISGIQPEIFQYILHPTGNIRICPVSDQIYGQISGLWQNILTYIRYQNFALYPAYLIYDSRSSTKAGYFAAGYLANFYIRFI